MTPNLLGEKQVQENKILPRSTTKQTPPCFKSRANVVSCPTSEKGIQACIPAGSLPGKHGLYSKDTKGYDEQKHQKAISKPTENLPWVSCILKVSGQPPSILSIAGGSSSIRTQRIMKRQLESENNKEPHSDSSPTGNRPRYRNISQQTLFIIARTGLNSPSLPSPPSSKPNPTNAANGRGLCLQGCP